MLSVSRTSTLAAALLIGATGPAEGQRRVGDRDVAGDAKVVAVNALVGGLSAGLIRSLRGGPFMEGFVQGAMGGAIAHLSRALAVARFQGAGLFARQMGALGASLARNGAFGSGPLDTLVLPVGPALVHMPFGEVSGTALRWDVSVIGWTVYGLLDGDLRFDLGRSISSGTPTFTTDDDVSVWGHAADGFYTGGIMVLERDGRFGPDPAAFAHERVHVLQLDFARIVWTLPLERALRRPLEGALPDWADRFELGLGYVPGWLLLLQVWDVRDTPWEVEARRLARR